MLIGLTLLAHMLNGCLNTANYPIFNVQDFRYWRCISIEDCPYLSQLVYPNYEAWYIPTMKHGISPLYEACHSTHQLTINGHSLPQPLQARLILTV